jgi:hypothetical protein
VGWTLTVRRAKAASGDDADVAHYINNAGMAVMLDVLDQLDVVDHESRPVAPLDPDDENAWAAAELLWESERATGFEVHPDRFVRVPAVIFESMDDRLLLPAECRAMATAFRSAGLEHFRDALVREVGDAYPITDADAQAWQERAHVFADFLDAAAIYGGCRAG